MTISAHDVARELRSQLPVNGGVTKIHKLLYLAQGWHLAWYNEPLFVEEIEAWDMGPVVADLWRDERDGRAVPTPEQLSTAQLLAVDYVVANYGALSARELIDLTHAEGPWFAAHGRDWREGKVIATDAIREFFLDAERRDTTDDEVWSLDAAAIATVETDIADALNEIPATNGQGGHRDETEDIRRWLAEVTA